MRKNEATLFRNLCGLCAILLEVCLIGSESWAATHEMLIEGGTAVQLADGSVAHVLFRKIEANEARAVLSANGMLVYGVQVDAPSMHQRGVLIKRTPDGTIHPIAQTFTSAPSYDGSSLGVPFNAMPFTVDTGAFALASGSKPVTNHFGEVAFVANLYYSPQQNQIDSGLWFNDSAGTRLVIRENDPVPGSPGQQISTFEELVTSPTKENSWLFFRSYLRGSVGLGDRTGWFRYDDRQGVVPIVVTNTFAPGTNKLFFSPRANFGPSGDYVVYGSLQTPGGLVDTTALWLGDRDTTNLNLVARTGDSIIRAGQNVNIVSISTYCNSAVNRHGDAAFYAVTRNPELANYSPSSNDILIARKPTALGGSPRLELALSKEMIPANATDGEYFSGPLNVGSGPTIKLLANDVVYVWAIVGTDHGPVRALLKSSPDTTAPLGRRVEIIARGGVHPPGVTNEIFENESFGNSPGSQILPNGDVLLSARLLPVGTIALRYRDGSAEILGLSRQNYSGFGGNFTFPNEFAFGGYWYSNSNSDTALPLPFQATNDGVWMGDVPSNLLRGFIEFRPGTAPQDLMMSSWVNTAFFDSAPVERLSDGTEFHPSSSVPIGYSDDRSLVSSMYLQHRDGTARWGIVLTRTADTAECPADFDGDGGLDVNDMFSFITAWSAQASAADTNADGLVTVQDLFDYLNLWFAGC